MNLFNVLLVDDAKEDLDLGTQVIQGLSHITAVHAVNTADHAIALLDGDWGSYDPQTLDLVITDWVMPGGGGERILEHVRNSAELALTPVVVLTAADAPRDIEKAYSCGANTVISKPLDFDDFEAAIQLILDYWTSLAQLPSRQEKSVTG